MPVDISKLLGYTEFNVIRLYVLVLWHNINVVNQSLLSSVRLHDATFFTGDLFSVLEYGGYIHRTSGTIPLQTTTELQETVVTVVTSVVITL